MPTLFKWYGIWLLADVIVFVGSLLLVWVTGSFVDLIVSLLMNAIFGAIPFPVNILAVWYVDPLSIIAQISVFAFLIVVWKSRE